MKQMVELGLPWLRRASVGMLASVALQAAVAAPAPVPAGVHMEGQRLVWQGEMTPKHVQEVTRLLKQENVDGLELRNSPGAGKFARPIFADTYKLLRERKLRTYARGLCASTCASIFLAGKEPTFLASKTAGVPTVLMFHAVNYKGAVGVDLTRTLVADIAAVRGERTRHLLLKVAVDGRVAARPRPGQRPVAPRLRTTSSG